MWVRMSRTTIGRIRSTSDPSSASTLVSAKAGMYVATGSMSRTRPSSNSIMSAVLTIGLVIEYMRKIVSSVTGFPASLSRWPYWAENTVCPRRASTTLSPAKPRSST